MAIPANVTVTVADGNVVTVKGPLGTLTQQFNSRMSIKQEGDKLEGVLMLQDDLYGSGKLVGYVNGKDVTIRSEGDTETFVNITWTGKMKDGEYKGTYRVEPTPSAALLGKEIQKGSFILLKQ